jgi:hypothetical protein
MPLAFDFKLKTDIYQLKKFKHFKKHLKQFKS